MQQLTAKKVLLRLKQMLTVGKHLLFQMTLVDVFSVLTAVGLLPIAASGADIKALMEGANAARKDYTSDKISETKLTNTQQFVTSFTVKDMQLKSW